MASERRTMRNWAARLSADDEALTLEEARTLAAIAQADRSLETQAVLQDIQARLTRLELFVQLISPGYDDHVRTMLKRQLTEAS